MPEINFLLVVKANKSKQSCSNFCLNHSNRLIVSFRADALEVIISYLSEMLNSDNCLYFRKLGHLHSLTKLVDETDQYILDHFEEIARQDAFFDLQSEEIDKLFASDNLQVG